jgi:steroid delta-isomerase-like uncharacterized protein
MGSKNVEKLRASHEVWNTREWRKAASAYAERATLTDHGRGITHKGRDEIVGSWVEFAKGFPDAEITDVNSYESGDTVVTTFIGRGTNTGEFMAMPATGRRVSLPLCSIAHFDAKGLIEREEQYSDSLSMLVQLGHASAPAKE